ncbi:hypothetical protein [Inquilinus sp. OTU3971]|uniref:hypothetical protein n=1 Tax=Inquilinus sp. OTU3971 TaxID=3043855 RepID=UPI00313B92D6
MSTNPAIGTGTEMDVDALMADLDAELSGVVGEIEEEIVEEQAEEIVEDVLAGIEETPVVEEPMVETEAPAEMGAEELEATVGAIEAKEAAYAGQEAAGDMTTEAPAASEPAKATSAKTPKAPKESKPRVSLETLDADNFALVVDDAERDANELKAEVLATKPKAVKIAEKFENLLIAVAQGKAPSVYTMLCFQALVEKGTVTSADFVAKITGSAKGDGTTYGLGTARSQSQQMMALFPTLKIAIKDGAKLRLNEDSLLAIRLKEIMSPTPAAA